MFFEMEDSPHGRVRAVCFPAGLYFVLHGCMASDFVLHGGGVCVKQMRIFFT